MMFNRRSTDLMGEVTSIICISNHGDYVRNGQKFLTVKQKSERGDK